MAKEIGSGVVPPEVNIDHPALKENDDLVVNSTGDSYSKYMPVDASNEMNQFEENIEEMLTRLDEFLGLVDIIRADTSLCLNQTLPRILAKGHEMEQTFERIDKLEAFVAMVKQQVNAMEEAVNQAESEMGSLSSIKKMFNSISMPTFLSKKNPAKQASPKPKPKFETPVIYKTEDYLALGNEKAEGASSEKSDTANSQVLPKSETPGQESKSDSSKTDQQVAS